jgi:hypothetical protein
VIKKKLIAVLRTDFMMRNKIIKKVKANKVCIAKTFRTSGNAIAGRLSR